MAQTPESKVKAKVVAQLKALGAYYFYPVRGTFFAIECKAGNNKPTPLQQKNIDAITKQGGLVWVVNEENLNEVTNILEAIP